MSENDSAAMPDAARILALDAECKRMKFEIFELRSSLIHACDLRQVSHDNERELWAMRQVANSLSKPFTHDAVQEKYNEWPGVIAQLKSLLGETIAMLMACASPQGARRALEIAKAAGLEQP